jgi:hypothetical protein
VPDARSAKQGSGTPLPLKRGLDVDEGANRFANCFHVLRELVHGANGRLPLEPSFEVKYRLGDHLHDDALALAAVRRRLYELRHPEDDPGAPGPEVAELLDALAAATSSSAWIEIAYGEAKPALRRAFGRHLELLDPVTDEPSLRLLTRLVVDQDRHLAEMGITERAGALDLAAQPIVRRQKRELDVFPRLDEPARDAFVTVTADGDPYLTEDLYVNGGDNHVPVERDEQKHFFHGLMDAELCAAELMARNSHEHPDMPWDFHVDMARQTWDELRHARVHDILMATELECRWGDYPVGFSYFKSIYALDLLGRLVLFNGTSEQKAMWRHSHRRKVLIAQGQDTIAKVFDYLLADEVPHVHNGVRWGSYLLGGDERAYRARVRELRAGLDRTGTPVKT